MKNYNEILISVVTPSYNAGSFIEEMLESVRRIPQELCEHIVYDGESTDDTCDILAAYAEKYNLFWVSEPDSGLYDALNKCLKKAKGEYIIWINADDILSAEAIDKLLELIAGRKPPLITGNAVVFSDGGQRTEVEHYTAPLFGFNFNDFKYAHLNCIFFRSDVINQLGSFDVKYRIAADRLHMMRLMDKTIEAVHLKCVVCYYRAHAGSLTFQDGMKLVGRTSLAPASQGRRELLSIAVSTLFQYRSPVVLFWQVRTILVSGTLLLLSKGAIWRRL